MQTSIPNSTLVLCPFGMPTYCCVQCYNCETFQIQQAKKSKKFVCPVCHEKQSFLKVLASSTNSRDVRRAVQRLNLQRGEVSSGAYEVPVLQSGGPAPSYHSQYQRATAANRSSAHGPFAYTGEATAQSDGSAPSYQAPHEQAPLANHGHAHEPIEGFSLSSRHDWSEFLPVPPSPQATVVATSVGDDSLYCTELIGRTAKQANHAAQRPDANEYKASNPNLALLDPSLSRSHAKAQGSGRWENHRLHSPLRAAGHVRPQPETRTGNSVFSWDDFSEAPCTLTQQELQQVLALAEPDDFLLWGEGGVMSPLSRDAVFVTEV